MANYCFNKITAIAENSEWKEISSAFENDLIDWPASMDGTSCDDLSKEILCTTKWLPTPWEEGKMVALSNSYPSVLFHYKTKVEGPFHSPSAWFCDGFEGNKREAERRRKLAYENEVRRFASATSKEADGICHRVKIMPDGRVAADGENRFGECNIFSWVNIKKISCGNWHTVGLRNDGTLAACGSNANGQCDIYDLGEPAEAVSCGRYHTAILLESGKVIVKGYKEQEAQEKNFWEVVPFTPKDFPLIRDLTLHKEVRRR